MAFLGKLRSLFHKEESDDEMPYSIVMLFRSPCVMTQEILEAAASKAYQHPYDGSHNMYFVGWSPALTTVKAGPAFIKVLEARRPYLGHEVAIGFRDIRLQDAWKEHRAWAAFDLMNPGIPKKEAYRTLAALVAELLDARCAGIFLPKENRFTMQSDGSAMRHLANLRK